jgi:hypothetical protein
LANRSTPSSAEGVLPCVVRQRQLLIPIAGPASREQLATYLALADRPLASLLARDRLQPVGPNRWVYRSNPHRLLHLEVIPTVSLTAAWEEGELRVRSTECRLAGLGRWGERLGFSLDATLRPSPGAIAGRAVVGLQSPLLRLQGGLRLAGFALEQALDRIERRLGRGFQKDVTAWLRGDKDKPNQKGVK